MYTLRHMPLLTVVMLTAAGCSYSYEFLVLGTFVDAVTGDPIEGVIVRFLEATDEHREFAVGTSDKRGLISKKMRVSDLATQVPWEARLERNGYRDQIIPLGDHSRERLAGKVTRIHMSASLVPLDALNNVPVGD